MEVFDIVLLFPVRFRRILKHFLFIFYRGLDYPSKPNSLKEWLIDFFFYILDLLGIAEIQQLGTRIIKGNIRKLTQDERTFGQKIFGDSIDFSKVWIDDKAKFGVGTIAIAYVSFNTINFKNKMKKEIFVHELVHIWQYQHFGSIYIGRAIKAQKSKEGYDYGGLENLYKVMLKNGKLLDFNFEQQAEIMEDYYKMIKNPSNVHPLILSTYTYFANNLIDEK